MSALAMTETVAPTEHYILAVEFRSVDGGCWSAIGRGATLEAALAFAHESCPDDTPWYAVRWSDVYGD
jgi:hypothetical protein